MLGADCSSTLTTFRLSDEIVEQLRKGVVDEDESAEVRYRVYFKESLVSQLLFEFEVQQHQKVSVVRRI